MIGLWALCATVEGKKFKENDEIYNLGNMKNTVKLTSIEINETNYNMHPEFICTTCHHAIPLYGACTKMFGLLFVQATTKARSQIKEMQIYSIIESRNRSGNFISEELTHSALPRKFSIAEEN